MRATKKKQSLLVRKAPQLPLFHGLREVPGDAVPSGPSVEYDVDQALDSEWAHEAWRADERPDPLPEDLAPVDDSDPALTDLRARIRGVLGDGGALSRLGGHYEERPQQLAMADLVLAALVKGNHAVVEAGTGTGKTLAYLVPALLSGKRVVVSTATKALQEQLVDKDLPLLQRTGARFSFAVMKGRPNYLCLLRKERFDEQPFFVSREEATHYQRVRDWAERTETGDRAELDLPESYVAWRDLSATSETCLGQDCPRYHDCFVTRMRQQAQEASIVVVNHHLFFADLALRNSPAGRAGAEVIPRADAVIFDEAHNIEEVAADFLGAHVSHGRLIELCRDVERTSRQRPTWPKEQLGAGTHGLSHAVDDYFRGIAALSPKALEEAVPETRWTLQPESLASAMPALGEVLLELDALASLFDDLAPGRDDPDAEGFRRRCEDARGMLETLSDPGDPNLVYWAEHRSRGLSLRAAPVDVARYLQRTLFAQPQPVVLTSATLSTGGDTSFFRRRIGLADTSAALRPTREASFPSPFDYERQAALYVPRHLPDPTAPNFLDQSIEEMERLIQLSRGRAFVLCTSQRAMQEAHRRLAPRLPYQVLVQGQRPKNALVRAFRERPSVLFATQSFWEGVDIQGDALSLVVIDKLPFASPGDPLVQARLQAITDRGGSAFDEYLLPAAAILLKQGFGRLIRSQRDSGAVAILDKRLWTRAYGSYLRRSLPPCPTFDRLAMLQSWWKVRRG